MRARVAPIPPGFDEMRVRMNHRHGWAAGNGNFFRGGGIGDVGRDLPQGPVPSEPARIPNSEKAAGGGSKLAFGRGQDRQHQPPSLNRDKFSCRSLDAPKSRRQQKIGMRRRRVCGADGLANWPGPPQCKGYASCMYQNEKGEIMGEATNRLPIIFNLLKHISEIYGGEGGIRTHGTREGSTVFETAAFDHSATSPHRGEAGI